MLTETLPPLLLLLSITPVVIAYDAKTPFDYEWARNIVFPFTAAAYAADPRPCLATVNATQLGRFEVLCDSWNHACAGFAARVPGRNAVVLSFRGTVEESLQIVAEAGDIIAKGKVPIEIGGEVASYFKNAFDQLWKGGLEKQFVEMHHFDNGKELWLTGHSLGGSMATIAAATITHKGLWPVDKIRLITYGEPRTGNEAFAKALDAKNFPMHRVVHQRDVVPHIPLPEMGYKHSRQEIFYGNNMHYLDNFIACSGYEDDKCSNSRLAFEKEDHLYYYETRVNHWHFLECQAPEIWSKLHNGDIRNPYFEFAEGHLATAGNWIRGKITGLLFS